MQAACLSLLTPTEGGALDLSDLDGEASREGGAAGHGREHRGLSGRETHVHVDCVGRESTSHGLGNAPAFTNGSSL